MTSNTSNVDFKTLRDGRSGNRAIDGQQLNPEAERKLVWKCDRNVLPAITFLYLIAFLDRSNIGNARIQGMIEDLQMTGSDYNVVLLIFFIPYVLFEVPSNIIIKRVGTSTWLSLNITLWGIATIGQGLVRNTAGLTAMRFLLGLFEAGFGPGCYYLISMYYTRYELQWRMSIFFSASIIAGAFSGLLAYAISNMDGIGGYRGWRWIFIIEGLFTVIVGIASKWVVADWPEKANFLTEEERKLLVVRLAKDAGEARMDRLDRKAWRRIVKDWKIYSAGVIYFGLVNTGYSGLFFIPTILQQMGFSAQAAQVRTIPIYTAATILALVIAVLTDRLRHRFGFCMLGIVLASIGYALLLNYHLAVGVRYFALFLVVNGGFLAQPVAIVWLANNMAGHYKRSIGSAYQVAFGNLGGIIASNIYVTSDSPFYKLGYGVSLGLLWVSASACVVLFLGVKRENRKRDRGERNERLAEADVDNMGDDHPHWRLAT